MADKIVRKELMVSNKLGLHARPAAMFVQLANKYISEITVKKGAEQVDGKSIMGIMMLAAGKGSMIIVTAKGEDAEEAVNGLEELLNERFGEG